jgi:hypothetical protein
MVRDRRRVRRVDVAMQVVRLSTGTADVSPEARRSSLRCAHRAPLARGVSRTTSASRHGIASAGLATLPVAIREAGRGPQLGEAAFLAHPQAPSHRPVRAAPAPRAAAASKSVRARRLDAPPRARRRAIAGLTSRRSRAGRRMRCTRRSACACSSAGRRDAAGRHAPRPRPPGWSRPGSRRRPCARRTRGGNAAATSERGRPGPGLGRLGRLLDTPRRRVRLRARPALAGSTLKPFFYASRSSAASSSARSSTTCCVRRATS